MKKKKKQIVVFAAHPDDEIIGCGGTMARHIDDGDDVHVIILAEGVTGRDDHRDRALRKDSLSELAIAAHKANRVLGVKSLTLEEFPDNRMDGVELLDVVKCIERHVASIQPSLVYTHHIGDVNVDHRLVSQAVVVACRPQPRHCVKEILFFEVASSTEWQPAMEGFTFLPQVYVDVSDTLKTKMRALAEYHQEMRPWPHARSNKAIEALAQWRGASVGVEAAEAFQMGRSIR